MTLWFRYYTGTVHDPKVQRLPGDTFKAWVNLLCLAAENDGILPAIEDVSYALRMGEDAVKTILEQLSAVGLLDETKDGLQPHNWDERQYKSDVSTNRVKRFRDKKRNVSGNVACNVSETAPETEQNRTESEQTRARGNVSETVSSKVRSRIVEAFEKGNSPNIPDTSRVDVWLAQGWDADIIVAVVAEGVKRKPAVSSLAYFENSIREAHERRNPKPVAVKTEDDKKAEWERIIRRQDAARPRPYRIPTGCPPEFVKEIQDKIDAEKRDGLEIPQFLDRRGVA